MANWKVLIVEDEEDDAEIISRILSHNGIDYTIVPSAERALELAKTQQFKAFLIDLTLPPPGMSGWALLQALRQNPAYKNIVAIAITSYHSTRAAHEAADAGFNAYFPKPVNPASFPDDLTTVLQTQQPS